MSFGNGLNWLATTCGVGLFAFVIAGCGSGSSGGAPYSLAVSSLEKHGEKIRDAFMAGKPDDAHDSLHEVGNVLDQFPKLVDGTKLTAADRAAAKQAADELFDSYTELDMSLHGGDEVKYEELSEKIDANLAILKGKIAAAGDSGASIVTAEHDDHGNHAHDDHNHAHEGEEEHDHEHTEGDGHDHDHEGQTHADEHEPARQ